jgi:colanic acid/amylovoran biosynthesis glycosyltransferase
LTKRTEASVIRVAYLNTQYPGLSHTFIEREIRAVRRQGVEVHPFSVRPPDRDATLGPAHQRAAHETTALLDSTWRLLRDACLCAIMSPLGAARALLESQRLSCPGPRSRLKHLAYTVEALRLVRLMRQRRLRHIHVHMANNGAAVALLATRIDARLTYSLSVHGSAEFFHVDTWRLAAKVGGARFVRCISNFCLAQIMAWTPPATWDKLHIVHCGVDPRLYCRKRRDRSGPLRLLAVGRMHPIKGYTLLLHACAQLSGRGIDWTLDMVGEGPLRAPLEALAEQLQISDRVSWSGPVGQDRILEHFERADVMVVSSFMEGVPVVLMEAMAMELAVVATAVGGIPELVEQDVSGILVPPASPEALLEAIVRIARDRAALPVMCAAARRKVCDQFDIRHVGREMAALLARYAGEALPAQAAAPEFVPAVQ